MDGLEGDAAKAKGVEIAGDVIEQLRFVVVISRRGRIGEVIWLEQVESVGPEGTRTFAAGRVRGRFSRGLG